MNSAFLQHVRPQANRRRVALTLSLSLLASISLEPVAAQSKIQKHITSVWTATSAEGSRVHVVSDSPINDYEAYTRGNRFYVKIPLSDLPSARGSLLGRGFDNVQIQRYGDGVIISFHLQPGTTARVEQNLNQLVVFFSTPGRSQGAASGSKSAEADRTRAKRITDAAGPIPLSSTSARSSRTRAGQPSVPSAEQARRTATGRGASKPPSAKVTGRAGQNDESRSATKASKSSKKPLVEPDTSKSSSARNAESPASTTPQASKEVASSATPLPSSSPALAASPTAPVAGSSISASPNSAPVLVATPTAQQPSSATSPNVASSSVNNDWRSRVHYWKVWTRLNWLPLLIGGLIGLALLVLLFSRRSAKRRGAAMVKPVPDQPVKHEAPAVTMATKESGPPTQSRAAVAAGARQVSDPASETRATVQPKSSDSPVGKSKPEAEEQEREVFEL